MTGPAPRGTRAVSVVIPTHNRRPLLQRALTCVLAQERVDLDVLVVNDGSSDDTAQFLAALEDPRVRVLHHEVAKGLPSARNAGLARVETPWVAFLDDDDLWSPTRLASQLDAVAATGAGWACSDAVLVDRRLAVLGMHPAPHDVDVPREILRRNVIPGGGSSVLACTELVREVGGFNPALHGVEDWDLWIRLAHFAPLATVRTADVAYDLQGGSMSRDTGRMVQGRDVVLRSTAAYREAAGVDFDYAWWDSYVLGLELASGRRIGAARAKARFLREANPVQTAAGLLAVMAAPRAVLRRHHRRERERDSGEGVAYAESWLVRLQSPSPDVARDDPDQVQPHALAPQGFRKQVRLPSHAQPSEEVLMASVIECPCGAVLRDEDDDRVVRSAQEHARAVHDTQLSEEQARSMAHPA